MYYCKLCLTFAVYMVKSCVWSPTVILLVTASQMSLDHFELLSIYLHGLGDELTVSMPRHLYLHLVVQLCYCAI